MSTEPGSVPRKVQRGETSRRNRTRARSAICYQYGGRDGESDDVRVKIDPSVDPAYSDFIQTSEPDARAYEDALPELPLPGSGELGSDCGEEIPALFCTGCGTPYEVGRTCRRSRCPRCWKSWAFQYGQSAAAKLTALARRLYSKENKTNIKQHHITVSLRDSIRFNSKNPFDRATEAVKALLAKVNVETGYLMYHSYRIAEEYRGTVLGHESGEGDMTWKDMLGKVESDSWTWEAVREEFLIYAPHFHVIALSEFVDCTSVGEIEEETGAVIHRITTRRDDGKEKSIDGIEELCKVTTYSLSHTGLALQNNGESYRAAVRPFGRVANFEAWDAVIGETKAAMRKVAPTVLGIEFPEPECTEHVHVEEDDNEDHVHDRRRVGSPSGNPMGSSSSPDSMLAQVLVDSSDDRGAWDASAGVVPMGISEPPEETKAPCGGQLAPMWTAGSYLGTIEWIKLIEKRYADGEDRLRGLRDAYEEWVELDRPRPVGISDDHEADDPPPE